MSEKKEIQEPQEEQKQNRIDLVQFGIFVSKLRSEKGMTQKQLAEKLYVSNKAVSKWEWGGSHS